MVKEFRAFILRGNLVDLAVAVVIGAAFTAVINALVKNLITPLIALIGGKPSFEDLSFKISDTTFGYGAFLNELVSFLIVAAVVFFFVVKPVNVVLARFKETEEEAPAPAPEVALLEEIRDLLREGGSAPAR